MTDQELKYAFNSMSRESFKEAIKDQELVLIADTQGLNGESASPMFYVESRWDVPIREKIEPIYLGS